MSGYFTLGGGGAGFWLVVDTVPELTTQINDAALPDGATCDVAELLDTFELDQSSILATDGITIVATMSGVGRWIRRCLPSLVWANRNLWYLDGVAGSDRADGGAPATALQTHEELTRRVGTLLGAGAAAITVYLLAPGFGRIRWSAPPARQRVAFTYYGTQTVIYSGSVTARVAYSVPPAAPVRGTMTDAAIPASWTASGLIGKLIVGTGGTIAGYLGFAMEDLGAKTAAFHPFFDWTTYNFGDPAVNDTFDVVELMPVDGVYVEGPLTLWLFNCAVNGGGPFNDCMACWPGSNVIPIGCTFDNGMFYTVGNCYLDPNACRIGDTILSVRARTGGSLILDCCAVEAPVRAERDAAVEIYEGCTFWGGNTIPIALEGAIQLMAWSWAAGFNYPPNSVGLRVTNQETARLTGVLWGLNNLSAYGIRCGSASDVRYTALPAWGPVAVADWICGTATTGLYAALPATVAAQLCGIIVDS